MENTNTLTSFNTESFNNFVHLDKSQKFALLRKKALLVDSMNDKNERVNLYFLDGYFIEEVINHASGASLILPYRHGYITERFVEVKQVLVPRIFL